MSGSNEEKRFYEKEEYENEEMQRGGYEASPST